MPLASLGLVRDVNKAMIDEANKQTPLGLLEQRRAGREAERVAAQEADAKSRLALEKGRAGQATRATEAYNADYFAGGPKLDNSSPQAMAESLRARAMYLLQGQTKEIVAKGNEMMAQLENARKGNLPGTGTAGEVSAQAVDRKNAAIAGAQEQYTQTQRTTPRATPPKLSPEDLAAFDSAVKRVYKDEQGMLWWGMDQAERDTILAKAKEHWSQMRAAGTPIDPEQAVQDIKDGLPLSPIQPPPPVPGGGGGNGGYPPGWGGN